MNPRTKEKFNRDPQISLKERTENEAKTWRVSQSLHAGQLDLQVLYYIPDIHFGKMLKGYSQNYIVVRFLYMKQYNIT